MSTLEGIKNNYTPVRPPDEQMKRVAELQKQTAVESNKRLLEIEQARAEADTRPHTVINKGIIIYPH